MSHYDTPLICKCQKTGLAADLKVYDFLHKKRRCVYKWHFSFGSKNIIGRIYKIMPLNYNLKIIISNKFINRISNSPFPSYNTEDSFSDNRYNL